MAGCSLLNLGAAVLFLFDHASWTLVRGESKRIFALQKGRLTSFKGDIRQMGLFLIQL
jgi:hypothetical protein